MYILFGVHSGTFPYRYTKYSFRFFMRGKKRPSHVWAYITNPERGDGIWQTFQKNTRQAKAKLSRHCSPPIGTPCHVGLSQLWRKLPVRQCSTPTTQADVYPPQQLGLGIQGIVWDSNKVIGSGRKTHKGLYSSQVAP